MKHSTVHVGSQGPVYNNNYYYKQNNGMQALKEQQEVGS